MDSKEIYLGDSKIRRRDKVVSGVFAEFRGEKYYKIANIDQMPDFFMTVVSNSDHWMFISSNGSLTAGRKNRDNALFPYYQVDKIHDYRGITGSRTYCLVEKKKRLNLWEPFTADSEKVYHIERNLYKSIYGNKLVFEEINLDLEICFRYEWSNSEKYGWIKRSHISNTGNSAVRIEVLDGIRNLLPFGVDYAFQTEYSNLLDAYKKCELLTESKLGLFVLSSIPVDKPEPSEALKASTVWSHGAGKKAKYLISDRQVENFKMGIPVETEVDVRAARGAYYIATSLILEQGGEQEWFIMAELNQDSADVANLDHFIKDTANIEELIKQDIAEGTSALIRIVASADGMQLGRDELASARHFSNALYNIMRGGVFADNYRAQARDFVLYVRQSNKGVFDRFRAQLEDLPEIISCTGISEWARGLQNPELERIALEYLPLTFSRRHGDPSRPWNQFSIDIKNSDGSARLNYQGNWRDIFQNWEALGLSYPEFIEGMLAKFLNASTVDGYNPYRITREGIDWECADPDDPWSFIGYWGDHQIIYLQKFLEQSLDFHPGKLDELLTREIFVFANVPYRIKAFDEIVEDPKDTILFDHELNIKIEALTGEIGADGRLLRNQQGEICRSNLAEKILITMLAKLSNFIPEAGIWLNTQRPEWNDANNALVGNGVSMVTLYYLRRFLRFWETMFSKSSHAEISISEEVRIHLESTFSVFTDNVESLKSSFSDEDRYRLSRALGEAGTRYRASVYKKSFSESRSTLQSDKLMEFMSLALRYVDHSIKMNRREDGLYHAYNLISFNGSEHIKIRHLYEMLEGQVAVLSSESLSAGESLEVLEALKNSRMFREDQYSYMLYPDRLLPRFVEKNNIPSEDIASSALLQKLLADKDLSVVKMDQRGRAHFNGAFRKAGDLGKALDKLSREDYSFLVQKEKELVLGIFERLFDHQSFTGRSGTFYGYEGLGSIYWHMVSKLLLAVQECYFRGVEEKADPVILGRIKDHYYEIKAGIGLYKSPKLYGAFPTDAYSHTPGNAGVKQPGLTGQVKEDVISRMFELGIKIENGKISFVPSLLNRDEILLKTSTFSYYDHSGKLKNRVLAKHQLGFTFCQFPVIYTFGKEEKVQVIYINGERKVFPGNEIPGDISQQIFSRNESIESIEFHTNH